MVLIVLFVLNLIRQIRGSESVFERTRSMSRAMKERKKKCHLALTGVVLDLILTTRSCLSLSQKPTHVDFGLVPPVSVVIDHPQN
jgi:hypothetical protein